MPDFFRRYLVAELYSLGPGLKPVFMLSPVKVDGDRKRLPTFFADGEYQCIRNLNCILLNNESLTCNIYDEKPFGCSVLLCSKMTESEPILLKKSFFYSKWLSSQDILFEIFPDLERCTSDLLEVSSGGRRGVA